MTADSTYAFDIGKADDASNHRKDNQRNNDHDDRFKKMVPSGFMYVVAMSGNRLWRAKPATTPNASAMKIQVVSERRLTQGLFAFSAAVAF